jgi:hypothetical protein
VRFFPPIAEKGAVFAGMGASRQLMISLFALLVVVKRTTDFAVKNFKGMQLIRKNKCRVSVRLLRKK